MNQNLHNLWQSIGKKDSNFTVPYDQFEIDMQDEKSLLQLHTNIAKRDENFTVEFNTFKTDMNTGLKAVGAGMEGSGGDFVQHEEDSKIFRERPERIMPTQEPTIKRPERIMPTPRPVKIEDRPYSADITTGELETRPVYEMEGISVTAKKPELTNRDKRKHEWLQGIIDTSQDEFITRELRADPKDQKYKWDEIYTKSGIEEIITKQEDLSAIDTSTLTTQKQVDKYNKKVTEFNNRLRDVQNTNLQDLLAGNLNPQHPNFANELINQILEYNENQPKIESDMLSPKELAELPNIREEEYYKDIWDSFYLGASEMKQKSKNYFLSVLPNSIFKELPIPVKDKEYEQKMISQGMWDENTFEEIKQEVIEQNKEFKIKRGKYRKKYRESQKKYNIWLEKHPEMQPPKIWEKGVIKTIENDPKMLISPAYWGYVSAQSAAFTIGIMGTTLGVTAITNNPVAGMIAGVAAATPMQSQDLYEDLLANGATEGQASKLSIPIGAAIATVEVAGDLPLLRSLSGQFNKLLTREIKREVAKRTMTSLARRGLKTFTTIEIAETIEEILQGAIQDATVKTVNSNRNILKNIPETVIQTLMATAPMALIGAGSSIKRQYQATKPDISIQQGAEEVKISEIVAREKEKFVPFREVIIGGEEIKPIETTPPTEPVLAEGIEEVTPEEITQEERVDTTLDILSKKAVEIETLILEGNILEAGNLLDGIVKDVEANPTEFSELFKTPEGQEINSKLSELDDQYTEAEKGLSKLEKVALEAKKKKREEVENDVGARTGKIKVYRGTGGGVKSEGLRILGTGTYGFTNRKSAERFGGEIEEFEVGAGSLLIIDDNNYRQIAEEIGIDIDNISSKMSVDELNEIGQKLENYAREQGKKGIYAIDNIKDVNNPLHRLIGMEDGDGTQVVVFTDDMAMMKAEKTSKEELQRKPVVAIGDIHGADITELKEDLVSAGIIDENGNFIENDRVFVNTGDLVDRGNYNEEVLSFFRDLKKQAGDNFVRLLGNHDLAHAMGEARMIGEKSNLSFTKEFKDAILNGDIIGAWFEGNTIFTHAGIYLPAFKEFEGKSAEWIVNNINERLLKAFQNNDFSDKIFDTDTGIFWIRPDKYNIENDQFRQVVGHTVQQEGIKVEEGRNVKFIDAGRVFGDRVAKPRELMFNKGMDYKQPSKKEIKDEKKPTEEIKQEITEKKADLQEPTESKKAKESEVEEKALLEEAKKPKSVAEQIINLTLDQQILTIPEIKIDSEEEIGAMNFASNFKKHLKQHIDSFAGKTRFTSKNSLEEIKKLTDKKLTYYMRRFDSDAERIGAEKAYKYIKEEIGKLTEKPTPYAKKPLTTPVKKKVEGKAIDKEKVTEKLYKAVGNVFNIPISDINIDLPKFQGRTEPYSQKTVDSIVKKFVPADMDAIVVWKNPKDNRIYVLKGHSKLEGHKQIGMEKIDAKFFEGTEEEAKTFGRESNYKNDLQVEVDDAKYIRDDLMKKNTNKTELRTKLRELFGKNAVYLEEIANLNPQGKAFTALTSFRKTTDKSEAETIKAVGSWIGHIRKVFSNKITNLQEDELFSFLMNPKVKTNIGSKIVLQQRISAIVDDAFYDNTKPFNLHKIRHKNNGEIYYNEKHDTIKQEIEDIDDEIAEYKNARSLTTKQNKIDFFNKKIKPLEEARKFIQTELMKLEQNKRKIIGRGINEPNLFEVFDNITPDESNLWEAETGTTIEEVRENENYKEAKEGSRKDLRKADDIKRDTKESKRSKSVQKEINKDVEILEQQRAIETRGEFEKKLEGKDKKVVQEKVLEEPKVEKKEVKKTKPKVETKGKSIEQLRKEKEAGKELHKEAKKYESADKFIKSISEHSKLAKDVKIDEFISIRKPEGIKDEAWYGSERLNQYNGNPPMGRVVKINPKSIVIIVENKGAWNDGDTYKIPKNAKTTKDLSSYKNMDKKKLTDIWNKANEKTERIAEPGKTIEKQKAEPELHKKDALIKAKTNKVIVSDISGNKKSINLEDVRLYKNHIIGDYIEKLGGGKFRNIFIFDGINWQRQEGFPSSRKVSKNNLDRIIKNFKKDTTTENDKRFLIMLSEKDSIDDVEIKVYKDLLHDRPSLRGNFGKYIKIINEKISKQKKPLHKEKPETIEKETKIKFTPLIRQFLDIKKKHPDKILLMRMGDFYETFFDDAKTISEILGVTLTVRDRKAESPIPLAGFPFHALDNYLEKLVEAGKKVAITEQVFDVEYSKTGKVVKSETKEITKTIKKPTVSKKEKVEPTVTTKPAKVSFTQVDTDIKNFRKQKKRGQQSSFNESMLDQMVIEAYKKGGETPTTKQYYDYLKKIYGKILPVKERKARYNTAFGKEIVIEKKEVRDIIATPEEIDFEIAKRAHSGTSFSPEVRAKSEQEDYANHINETYEELRGFAKSKEQRTLLDKEFVVYKERYKRKLLDYLHSQSGLMSTMITGAAKFPVRRMERIRNTINNKLEALMEYDKKAQSSIRKKLKKQDIEDRGGELAVTEKRLVAQKKAHEMMKLGNAILRKKNLSDNDIKKELGNVGFSEKAITSILEPDYMGHKGFAQFELTNSNATIKRLQEKVDKLKSQEDLQGQEPTVIFENEEVKIINNYEQERVQLLFDGKPNAETITKLKKNGYRWSPKNKAWQRKNTANGLNNAKRLFGEAKYRITPQMKEGVAKGQELFKEGIAKQISETESKAIQKKIERTNKFLFGKNRPEIRFVDSIKTVEGRQMLGKVQGAYMDIVKGRADMADTQLHESVHFAIAEFLTIEEGKVLFDTGKSEEQIAEFIIEYAKAKALNKAIPSKGFKANARKVVDKLVRILNRLFGHSRKIDSIYDFYDSLLAGEFASKESRFEKGVEMGLQPSYRDYAKIAEKAQIISEDKRKKLFSIAAENFFNEKELHQIVENITDKKSIREITNEDADIVIKALKSFRDVPSSKTFNVHLEYLENIQLPQTSEVRKIKYQLKRINGKRLAGTISTADANKEIIKLKAELLRTAKLENISIRYTKAGNPILSVRQADTFVPQEFTNYAKFKDVGQIAGGGTDVTRLIQQIDGSLSVREKRGVVGQAGQLEQKVLWRTRDIMLQKINYGKEKLAELAKIFHGIKHNSKDDIAITNALRNIEQDMTLSEAYEINQGIENRLIRKAYKLRKWYDNAIAEQNYSRLMRNQEDIPFKDKYSPEILRDATIWERLKSVTKDSKEMKDSKVLPDFVKPNKPFNPREMANKHAIPYKDQVKSAMDLSKRYLQTASKDIFNTTVIQNNKAFIQQLESLGYEKSAASIADWTAEAYAGIKPKFDRFLNLPPKVEKAMRYLNNLRNVAVFPLNFAWSLFTQPLSIANTFTKYGIRNTGLGFVKFLGINTAKSIGTKLKGKHFISPYSEFYSYVIKSEKTGRISRQDAQNATGQDLRIYKTWKDVLADFSTILTDNMEKLLTGTSIEAAFRMGKKRGLTGKALIEFASDAGGKTQSMYNQEDKPGVLRATAVKTVAPYQTYCFEMVNNLREWAGKTGTPPSTKMERLSQVIRFISVTTVMGLMSGLGRDKDPKWTIESFMPFSEFWFTPFAKHQLKRVPYARWWSSSARQSYGNGALVAPVDLASRFGKGLDDILTAGNWRKMRNVLMTYLPGVIGVPGGVQISRITDATIAYSKGGVFDKNGRLLFSIDTPDNLLKGMFSGVWTTSGGIEYLEKRYGKTVIKKILEGEEKPKPKTPQEQIKSGIRGLKSSRTRMINSAKENYKGSALRKRNRVIRKIYEKKLATFNKKHKTRYTYDIFLIEKQQAEHRETEHRETEHREIEHREVEHRETDR